ncbi:MAG: hypothetical protein HY521_08050 [Proteobacteria bacterium]|nr:hypothetical protein [Pseudomonadota bacterium]
MKMDSMVARLVRRGGPGSFSLALAATVAAAALAAAPGAKEPARFAGSLGSVVLGGPAETRPQSPLEVFTVATNSPKKYAVALTVQNGEVVLVDPITGERRVRQGDLALSGGLAAGDFAVVMRGEGGDRVLEDPFAERTRARQGAIAIANSHPADGFVPAVRHEGGDTTLIDPFAAKASETATVFSVASAAAAGARYTVTVTSAEGGFMLRGEQGSSIPYTVMFDDGPNACRGGERLAYAAPSRARIAAPNAIGSLCLRIGGSESPASPGPYRSLLRVSVDSSGS